jgi:hypothetical protein
MLGAQHPRKRVFVGCFARFGKGLLQQG